MFEQIEISLKKNLKGDPIIWMIVFVLSVFSILVVYSAVSAQAYKHMEGNTEYYLVKHVILLILTFVSIWVAHNINYVYYSRISRLLLIISVPLLLYTYFKGVNVNGASRWIMIPIINQTFQTSDLAKLALIANLASMLGKRQKSIDDFRNTVFPIVGWCGVICGLIALSNFSTAAMLFLTCMIIMYIGRVPMRYLIGLVSFGIPLIGLALMFGSRGATVVSRIKSFLGASDSLEAVPYQAEQAYIALANGGLFGVGPGDSTQRYFLPEAFSDYIYAIINEEYGFIAGATVLLLYLGILYRGMVVASKSEKAFGGLLSVGLSFTLVIQAMINMAVVVGIFPVTGQPLPLISLGGTSLLFTGFTIGVILSVSRGDISEEALNSEKDSKSNTKSKPESEPDSEEDTDEENE